MGNLFSTCDLFTELKRREIWAVDTIRNNRLKCVEKITKLKSC